MAFKSSNVSCMQNDDMIPTGAICDHVEGTGAEVLFKTHFFSLHGTHFLIPWNKHATSTCKAIYDHCDTAED